MSVKAFKQEAKDSFKDDLGEGGMSGYLSTGCYDLDRALNGGLRFGRFHLWAGKESAGKTSMSLHTMRQTNLINWETGKYDPSLSNPTPVMFVDLEGTYDDNWAEKIGVPRDAQDDYNYVARPATGNVAADLVLNGLESGEFGLIIVDSNEAFTATTTLEKSTEDNIMCDRAKILARMYRVGQAHMNRMINKDKPWKTPTILCLNQIRDQIGGYGASAPVYPGGRSQLQYSSTIVQFNSPLVMDDQKKSYGKGEFKGVVKKNKCGPPKKNFAYQMAIRDMSQEGDLRAGQIDNSGSILKDIKSLGLMTKTDSGYEVFNKPYRVQSDFKKELTENPQLEREVWYQLIEMDRT